ncbi:MAG: hypothetical protein LBI59_06155, partial [Candidatus Accumulibacter sp.]|nr:hypothetical protein [Accumulibacter sp.]
GATSSTLLPVIARAEDPRSPTNDEAEELARCLNFAQGIFKTASSASAAGQADARSIYAFSRVINVGARRAVPLPMVSAPKKLFWKLKA